MNPSPEPPSDDAVVGIVEGSKIAGVTPNTLRRWADLGLVPAYRTPSNQRRFKTADLRDLLRPEVPAKEAS